MSHSRPVSALVSVLVVDSRAIVRRGLAELINTGRPLIETVETASTYGQALELAERLRPEVVVLAFFQDLLDAFDAVRSLTHRWGAQVEIIKDDELTPVAKFMNVGARGTLPLSASGEVIVREIIGVSHLANDPTTVWLGTLAQLPMQVQEQASRHLQEHTRLSDLTARELAVVRAIVSKPSAKYITIGAMLGVSEHCIHNHLTSIYQKLNLTNRVDLLVYASRHQGGALEPLKRA